jgi:hypothetical protein
VQVVGDLEALVVPLLGHAVGQGSEEPFAVLQLVGCFLESNGAEEHLSSEEKGQDERDDRPMLD